MRVFQFLILAISLFLASSCGPTKDNGKIIIVTTTGIVGDCVRAIVGDQAEVISLMGAGVDPHLYKASQGDISKLSSADIIVYSGLHLEGKMAQMLENYGKQKAAFAVGNYVTKSELKQVDATSNLVDPHIWFNPKLWLEGLQGVAQELNKIEGLQGTAERFYSYKAEVEALVVKLNQEMDSSLTQPGQRILITSHDAFEYFGDAFKFKVRGLQGISTAAEYGAKDVKDLIDFIVDNNIKSVFIETSVSDKNLKSVIEGAKARGYDLKIGGTLYSDALGEEGTPAGTYQGMLQANVNTIMGGLK
jgi:manganese/zinc/iron transport system substrate-binding protein